MTSKLILPAAPAIIKARTDSDLDAVRAHWKVRLVHATSGHMTPLGGILLAVLGRGRDKLPRFGDTAWIDENGIVRVDWTDFAGKVHKDGLLAPVEDFRDMFRQLADQVRLEDAERVELFDELRKWIAIDKRQAGGRVDAHGELLSPEED